MTNLPQSEPTVDDLLVNAKEVGLIDDEVIAELKESVSIDHALGVVYNHATENGVSPAKVASYFDAWGFIDLSC